MFMFIHEQLTHDTSEVTHNIDDLVRLEVDNDNAFFEVVVDVNNLGDVEDENDELSNIMEI